MEFSRCTRATPALQGPKSAAATLLGSRDDAVLQNSAALACVEVDVVLGDLAT
jgi:hypothetical protein